MSVDRSLTLTPSPCNSGKRHNYSPFKRNKIDQIIPSHIHLEMQLIVYLDLKIKKKTNSIIFYTKFTFRMKLKTINNCIMNIQLINNI
jgi:hypothetical protein